MNVLMLAFMTKSEADVQIHIAVFPFMETLTDVETHTLIPIHRNAADTQTV